MQPSGRCRGPLAFVRRFYSPRISAKMRTQQRRLQDKSQARCTAPPGFRRAGWGSWRGNRVSLRQLSASPLHLLLLPQGTGFSVASDEASWSTLIGRLRGLPFTAIVLGATATSAALLAPCSQLSVCRIKASARPRPRRPRQGTLRLFGAEAAQHVWADATAAA